VKARFAVGTPTGPRSSVWTVWCHTNRAKADVFLAPRAMAGALKISFHQSGENRDAFTREYQLQHANEGPVASNRARAVWHRAEYSEGGVSRLYQVCFPHSELRTWTLEDDLVSGDVRWIPASAHRDATFVEFLLTQPGRDEIEFRHLEAATDGPLAHWYLPTGENFLVVPRYGDLDQVAKQHIAVAANRVPDGVDRTPVPSIRLNLTMEPVKGLGVTVETAWPCTVG